MARLAGQLDINSVMVVSAGVGEGKSTTAANLAVVLAETGKDVLLVSADCGGPGSTSSSACPTRPACPTCSPTSTWSPTRSGPWPGSPPPWSWTATFPPAASTPAAAPATSASGRFRSLCRRHEAAANHFGYSLVDLDRADPFPVGSAATS